MLSIQGLSFSYPSSPVSIFEDLSLELRPGWTAIVGANGCGKSTLLRLLCGELVPSRGHLNLPGAALYCPQPTETEPALLEDFGADWGAEAGALRARLGIGEDWAWRYPTLSHGERKRLQLAVALWRSPHVLAVDEPTNHLDAAATAMIAQALERFEGVGLLVSHERALLDRLASHCLMLGPSGPQLRPGNYTQARSQAQLEQDSLRRERDANKRELQRLEREAKRRAQQASQADAKRSMRHLDKADSDGRARIGLAILTGKDARAGRLARQQQARVDKVAEQVASMQLDKSYEAPVWLPDSYSRRAFVATLPASKLELGPSRCLHWPDLHLGARERVAVWGSNGAGKSTLLRTLVRAAFDWDEALPPSPLQLQAQRVLYLPQELSAESGPALLEELRGLGDEQMGQVLALVSRLGSRPERILDGHAPSPGELRKLYLAQGIVLQPHLLILDEPSNHLDLPATEALEAALAASPCALLLVSHDSRLVARLCQRFWCIDAATGVLSVRDEAPEAGA
ncbi:MAG: ATP-binding cassette domain-containing protein [Myxococcota bacterium]|jgi:ATPase subunit of ABC transporter with duplicated ATPase domains|nr:ATP-binding cassette domain-containing protein [Myxococcota bacterium]